MKANKNPGQRGKVAEKKVRDYLEALSGEVAEFDYSRIYDARSAGGKFPSRPGDFEFYRLLTGDIAVHGLIEAKEVAHDFRLPAKNFRAGQLGKLQKRELAGGLILVLVLHTTLNKWRRVPFNWLFVRAGDPSWDLSPFKLYDDVAQALKSIHAVVSRC